MVEWCLERRKTVIALTLAAFVLSLLAFKLLVAQQFFPSSNRPELMVDMWRRAAPAIRPPKPK